MGLNWSTPLSPLQIETNFHYASWDKKNYDPACLHKINIERFDTEIIQSELKKFHLPADCEEKITRVISHYHENEDKMLIKKIDGFLFYKSQVPLLEIYNSNAEKDRNLEKNGPHKDRLYSLKFDINSL